MVKITNNPEQGELVVATVTRIVPYGAEVRLDEYPRKHGFVHISEIAAGWVKHIRNFVKENQKVVCKVLRLRPERNAIDLSLKQVNVHQKREKIQEWKEEMRAEKLFEIIARKIGKNPEDCYKDFGYRLIETFGGLYRAFEEASSNENVLKEEGFEGDWICEFVAAAKENIVPQLVEIKGYLRLTSTKPEGIMDIKKALVKAESVVKKYEDVDVEIQYTWAPKYRIHVRATD